MRRSRKCERRKKGRFILTNIGLFGRFCGSRMDHNASRWVLRDVGTDLERPALSVCCTNQRFKEQ